MSDKRLVDYIKEQLKKGYTKSEIIPHLVRSGHTKSSAENAFEKAVEKKIRLTRGLVELLSLVLLALFIFWIGLTSEASGMSVIAGFFPSILSIIFFITVVETGKHEKYLWSMPLILSVVFVILGTVQVSVFGKMEVFKLALLNLVISYAALIFITYPETYVKAGQEQEVVEIKSVEHHFQSIEDKCKAINFVIGRVYRSSNGSSTKLRDKIRIDSEIYNAFDKAVKEGTREEQVVELNKIGDSLMKLQKKEKDIFGVAATKHLKNLFRNEDGTSRIIDVLAHNDNDPVMLFYEGALEACRALKERLEGK